MENERKILKQCIDTESLGEIKNIKEYREHRREKIIKEIQKISQNCKKTNKSPFSKGPPNALQDELLIERPRTHPPSIF